MVKGYGILVENEVVAVFYWPFDGKPEFVEMTAALQSNPTIVWDQSFVSEEGYRYLVYVDNEFVNYLYYTKKEGYIPDPQFINLGLQSNPTIKYIDVDFPVKLDMRWQYDGTNFSLKEE